MQYCQHEASVYESTVRVGSQCFRPILEDVSVTAQSYEELALHLTFVGRVLVTSPLPPAGLTLFEPDEVSEVMGRWHEEYVAELPAVAEEAAAERARAARLLRAPPTELLLAHDATVALVEAQLALGLAPGEPAQCARGAGAFHADTLLNYLRADSNVSPAPTARVSLRTRSDVRVCVAGCGRSHGPGCDGVGGGWGAQWGGLARGRVGARGAAAARGALDRGGGRHVGAPRPPRASHRRRCHGRKTLQHSYRHGACRLFLS